MLGGAVSPRIAVVVPVYRNADTLCALAGRLDVALDDPWTLRLVVDACPEGSAAEALSLAAAEPRIRATVLPRNVGQHRAIATGLEAEPGADVGVCMDGDLQDPPEAVPLLVNALAHSQAAAVFAGRRGAYESRGRRLTGNAHRRALAALTGLPRDAGAFLAMDARARHPVVRGVLRDGAPSVVVAAAGRGLPLSSVPVGRDVRRQGTSAWTSYARMRHSARTLVWAAGHRTSARLTPWTP
jgi:glycosyltransferase involved in cell wall biosynthesis